MRYFIFVGVLTGGLCLAALAADTTRPAEAPSTQPATRPTTLADETPRQSLQRGCDVLDRLSLEEGMRLYAFDDATEERVARSNCLVAIAMTRVEKLVVEKFGRKVADDVVHAAGQQTRADCDSAKVEVHDDQATVQFPGADPLIMSRTKQGWKISVKASLAGFDASTIKAVIDENIASATAFAHLAEQIDRGEIKSSDEIIARTKKTADGGAPMDLGNL